jgi:hypothetical protein
MHRPSGSETSSAADLTRTGEAPGAGVQPADGSPDDKGMQTYEAAVTLPMAHVMAATARLRGDLRRQILAEGGLVLPDWPTLRVTPPVELFDDEGRVVYQYRATVEVHDLSGLLDPTAVV